MQGNATEIDERNLLQLDALLSHGYGLSPQLVMRSKGLSIEAKALYGYLSSFAGAGDTAFPSTSRILEELDISKNRFYKIRKELVSWGFISIETTATSAGLRTVYTLPQNPIAIKTEIDEIANRRNEIKSSLVANLHNEDMVSHKRDSESECLQQSAGNEPCRQSEAKAQNRGSNLKPCLQSEDEGCLQSGDKLYIDTNINPKVSIDRSAAHPSDDEGPSDWKVTEGMTDPTQRDDGESDRGATGRNALDAVPDGTYDPLPTVADGYTLSNSEFEAFNRLCSLSIKTVREAVRNEAAKQYAKRLGEGYSPATIEKAYIDYAEAYRQNNPSPRFAKQLSDWFVKSDGFAYFAKKPVIRTTTATKATSGQDSDLRAATEAKNDRLTLAATDPTFRDLEAAVSKARSLWGHACMTSDVENASLDLGLELGIRHGLVTKPLPLLYVRPAAIDPCDAFHDLRAAARDYRGIDRMMAIVASILLPFLVNNPDTPDSTHERRRGAGNAENMLPLIIGEWQLPMAVLIDENRNFQ